MIKITDISDPRIELYKSLRYTPKSHYENNIFVAESEKVVLSLLSSQLRIKSIFALPEFYNANSNLIASRADEGIELYTAEKSLMSEIIGFKIHSGSMALGQIPAQFDIMTIDGPLIAMNGIINAENVGSIIRNMVAFGLGSLLIDKQTCSPFSRRAVRVSMGASFSIKYCICDTLLLTLQKLKNELKYEIISLELTNHSISINDSIINPRSVVILGSEGYGVGSDILSFCDKIIKIPISSAISSLNVTSASAILFWELANKKGLPF